MNKYIVSGVLVGVLSVGSWVWAEDGVPSTTNVPGSPSIRAKMKEHKDQLLRQNVKNEKTKLEIETENAREQFKIK